ncbi:MAG: radical SAM protein [Thermodesulfovibrionales bacterium]|nr:radical SAM protein [Thermodesulfovibrionales bacterium]
MVAVGLARDAFTRRYGGYFYITHQKSGLNHTFKGWAAEMLSKLGRVRIDQDLLFRDVPIGDLATAVELLKALHREGFVHLPQAGGDVLEDPIRKLEVPFPIDYFRENYCLTTLEIEILTRCNERCIHCYIPHNQKTVVMGFELAERTIEQARALGAVEIMISGGEVLMHPELRRIIASARKYDLSMTLFTNLTMIGKEHVDIFMENNLREIRVSLYSMDEAVHDLVTQVPGSQQLTRRAIELLVKKGLPAFIVCPVLKENFGSYQEVTHWGASLGIQVSHDPDIFPRLGMDTTVFEHRLDLACAQEVFRQTLKTEAGEMMDALDAGAPSAKEPVCGIGCGSLSVTADGTVFPCSFGENLVLGNLNTQSLGDIYRHSSSLKMLRSLAWGDFETCRQCPARLACGMCVVRNYAENGDVKKLSPYHCEYSKIKYNMSGMG